jgi:rhodanese-related sulfurtransferase
MSAPGEGMPIKHSLRNENRQVMKNKIVAILAGVLGLMQSGVWAAGDGAAFPHRAKFKEVPVMELAELRQQLDNAIVIDVRSRYEYDTLHIKGAVHIVLSREKLPAAVRELRSQTGKPIVFYCNGTTCKKSYEAAALAIKAGVSNVHAYDAGIDAWSRQYPEQCVLMGKNPITAADLISRDAFKKRLVTTEQFEAYVEKGAVILDIRDLRQRDVALFPMRELRAPLDDAQKIAAAVTEAKRRKKILVVYDKVGKQTRWFQYYLEQQGVRDYFFLEGGAEGYHEAKYGKLQFKLPDQG